MPLLANLLGTESRICRALDAESIEEATGRVERLLNAGGGEGWLDRLRFGSRSSAVAGFAASRVKSGACQQIVRLDSDVDLEELPCLHVGAEIASPTIPSATMLSAEPDTHALVFLQVDLQIRGRNQLVAAWSDIASAAPLLQEYANRHARMPVAVVIGGDPSVHLALAAPVPASVDPLGLAGWLREKPLDAVACRSIDLLAPAETDIVIEGYIDASDAETRTAPRFSPGGYIIAEQPGSTIHVTAMTHRANRIFPAAIPSSDCNEVALRDQVMARIFLPLLKLRIPELVDFDLPLSGSARHLAILAIRKTYAGQARHVATVAWGLRPLGFAKLLVLVDAEVEVRNTNEVWRAISHQAHLARDVWTQIGALDPLDPISYGNELGHRMAIDATRKVGAEGQTSSPRSASLGGDLEALVTDRWSQYGLGPND
jgi:4-hydroxy-3-polyprenylbenzoate decarboxylase